MNYTILNKIPLSFFTRFLATDPETNKQVILDEVIIDGEWNNIIKFYSFCQEFTLNDLPGVVHLINFTKSLIGIKEPNNSLKTYFVHENFSNGNLFKIIPDYLKNHNYPGINSTVRSKIIFGVASTMKYAHRRKIPHLKLELENIYIDENYEPRIANFTNDHKLSSQYALGFYQTVRNHHKMPLIPEYIAKEDGEDDSDGCSYSMKFTDIYDFGCFLCQMFSNEFSHYLNRNYKLPNIPKPTIPQSAPTHYQDLIRRIFSNQINSFDEIVDILKNDIYAINEFGQNTDLQELHRYQEFIDRDPTPEVKAEDIAANVIFDPDEDIRNSIEQIRNINFNEFDFPMLPNKTQFLRLILEEKQKEIDSLKSQIQQMTRNDTNTDSITIIPNTINVLTTEDVSKLRRIEEIGSGSFGHVYKVGKEEFYATKVINVNEELNIEHVRSLLNEYEILNNLNHPNILKTFGFYFGDETNPPTMLIEYCSKNIDKEIKHHSLTNVQIAFSIYQIVEGFRFIHFKKIIHRDIKPKNILMTNDGTIKICDFGISKLMSPEEQTMTLGLGTQKFMAPEIINENSHYTEKVDIYSFGVLLYFILCQGQMPSITVPQMAAGRKAQIPENVNEFARNLINNCWNFDPETRPSFDEICRSIEQENFKVVDLSQTEVNEVERLVRKHKSILPNYI